MGHRKRQIVRGECRCHWCADEYRDDTSGETHLSSGGLLLMSSWSCDISTDFVDGEHGRMNASVELLTFGYRPSGRCHHHVAMRSIDRQTKERSVDCQFIRLGLRNIMITTSYKILSIGASFLVKVLRKGG